MNFPTPGAEAREYGKRGNAAANALARYRIEGEFVTMTEIAARTGRTKGAVRKRMAELRGASGAVTWARLAA